LGTKFTQGLSIELADPFDPALSATIFEDISHLHISGRDRRRYVRSDFHLVAVRPARVERRFLLRHREFPRLNFEADYRERNELRVSAGS
jgi:hypothetical protein